MLGTGRRGRLTEGGSESLVWWRMLSRVHGGVGMGVGDWFDDNVRKVVGGGRSTLFGWTIGWVVCRCGIDSLGFSL